MNKKGIINAVLILAIIAGIVAIIWFRPKVDIVQERPEQSSSIEAAEIIRSFKISSLTYRYTNVMYDTNVKYLGDFEVPLTRRHLGVSYDGVMEIGIDGSKIEVVQVDNIITIRLPEVEILAHTPVKDSTKVLFDIGAVFDKNEVSDYVNLFNTQQQAMEDRVVSMGILDQAAASAKEQLAGFLESIPDIKENYDIIFEQ